MKLAQAQRDFLLALGGDGRSENTLITYERILGRFERYLAASRLSLELEELSPLTIQGYLKAMRDAGLKPKTVDGAYSAISSLMAWATNVGHIESSPTKKMRYRRDHSSVPRALAAPVIWTALNDMTHGRFHGIDSRDRMAVLLMFLTGARVSEACSMTWDEVLWDRNMVLVPQTKSGPSERHVPLHDKLRTEILRHRRVVAALWPDCRYILQSRSGKPIRRMDIQRAFKVRAFPFTAHVLRHSYATELLRARVPIRRIQSYLGHKNLEMSSRYLALLPSDMTDDVADLASAFAG